MTSSLKPLYKHFTAPVAYITNCIINALPESNCRLQRHVASFEIVTRWSNEYGANGTNPIDPSHPLPVL